METTHGKACAAFVALSQIRSIVKGLDALHVFHMRNKLKDAVDFMAEEELKIVNELDGMVTETGTVIIPDKEKRKEYLVGRKKLEEMPYEVNADPITIQIDRCPDVTAEQIEMLDGFVIFKEGEEDDGNK